MSEQDKQIDTEQEIDSQSSDSLTDPASTTDQAEINDSDFGGEESDSVLDVDTELSTKKHTVSVADEQRQKQVNSYEQRLADGEISREDIPSWVLKRIDFKNDEPNIDSKIDQKVAERLSMKEDEAKATSLKNKLKTAKITKSQKEKLLTRFNSLKEKLGEGEALEVAIESAGIQFESKETKSRPSSMNPPATSSKKHEGKIDDNKSWKEVQKTHSEEERRKHLISQLES